MRAVSSVHFVNTSSDFVLSAISLACAYDIVLL